MKVTLSAGGRFHSVKIAEQLHKQRILDMLLTGESLRNGDKLPSDKYRQMKRILPLRNLEMAGYNISLFHNFMPKLYWMNLTLFDKWAAKRLPDSDIFYFLTMYGLESAKEAKRKGMITIAENGGTFIKFQREIVKEEYRLQGMEPSGAFKVFGSAHDDMIIKRNLSELDAADYIFVPSTFACSTFPAEYQHKVIVNECGVDLAEFPQVEKEDDIFRIIYVGRAELQKGVHYLLQAFTELDLPNSELYMVGPIENGFKQFMDKYKSDKIKHIGHVPHDELYKHYCQGSVLVQPSIQDGFSLVITEAMACGLPVIVTENTAADDVVRELVEGFVVPIRNVRILKRRIQFMYDNHALSCYLLLRCSF